MIRAGQYGDRRIGYTLEICAAHEPDDEGADPDC
jgi:hypothetical protein